MAPPNPQQDHGELPGAPAPDLDHILRLATNQNRAVRNAVASASRQNRNLNEALARSERVLSEATPAANTAAAQSGSQGGESGQSVHSHAEENEAEDGLRQKLRPLVTNMVAALAGWQIPGGLTDQEKRLLSIMAMTARAVGMLCQWPWEEAWEALMVGPLGWEDPLEE